MVANLLKGADPNSTLDDVPLFVHLAMKAVSMDTLSQSLNVGDADTEDRTKLQKILKELTRYGVNMNVRASLSGSAALHCAAIAGDAKLVKWLLENGADLSLRSSRERMTALMYAARYGHIRVIAEIVRRGGVACMADSDFHGRNAMHYAAMSGQTRTAKFFITIGGDKRLKDNDGKTPSALAQGTGYGATSREIATHAMTVVPAGALIGFLWEEEKNKNNTNMISQTAAVVMKGLQNLATSVFRGGGRFEWILGCFGRKKVWPEGDASSSSNPNQDSSDQDRVEKFQPLTD